MTTKRGAGLAPMAGVTDAAMRLLCHEQGSAWAVSEMLSAKGWVYSGRRNKNAADLIRRLDGEGPAGLQLFGSDPKYMAEAARQLEDEGFQFIDINFGCPAPKITGNGEGSAMLKRPDEVAAVVRAVTSSTRLPVTVKIRSGWDAAHVNAPQIARICEDNGAKAVAVHARTREQQYSGEADWSVIREVKRAVKVPVFGNGDVRSGADAVRMIEETGCDGVIVGRAAQGDPWIFREIRDALTGRPYQAPSPEERVEMALRHFDLEVELYGEKRGLLEMRKHIAWYVHGMKGATRFRDRINLLKSPKDVRDALTAFAASQRDAEGL
ncbi:MAG: tRNA dihydrouridine synthase DusB [Clostridia bacterium]|nr:tRNA dihydrouridine synthase DusB [Clostridia bacterium]